MREIKLGTFSLIFAYLILNVLFMFWIIYLNDYYTLNNWNELLGILIPSTFLGFAFGIVSMHYTLNEC